MNSPSLAPLFLRIRQTHGSCYPRSQRAIIELRAQKAKQNHFKPSQGESNFTGCTPFVTPPFLEFFLVTIRRDGFEQ